MYKNRTGKFFSKTISTQKNTPEKGQIDNFFLIGKFTFPQTSTIKYYPEFCIFITIFF